jgi:hypothetical protein
MAYQIKLLQIAKSEKPAFSKPCNNCGYCCLMEPCAIGKELTGKQYGACELLVSDLEANKHYCQIILNDVIGMKDVMGIGTGCCAKTQDELIASL